MARSIPGTPTSSEAAQAADRAATVADLLHQVNHRIHRVAAEELEPLRITSAQMRALRTLHHHGAPMRMSGLAAALGIVRRSATSVVDELEARGLVERMANANDRRAVEVQLTDAGRETLAELRGRRVDAAGRVLGQLNVDDLEQLRVLLERLRC